MSTSVGRIGSAARTLAAIVAIAAGVVPALAQSGLSAFTAQTAPLPSATAPGAGLAAPGGGVAPAPSPPPQPAPALPPQVAPMVPPGQVALSVHARFGRDLPPITSGLHWRVFNDKPEPNGMFRLVKEDRTPNPIFVLPPGGYIVHVSFGHASAVKPVLLRGDNLRESFDIPAGGLRLEGRVGNSRVPASQISFDIYKGSQFEPGDKRPLVNNVLTGDVVLLPEGTYHIVSNYGDANAVVRSDIRVQTGALNDVTVKHRAAAITLKLVYERGGEALANTQWSVLTPGGDVVKESLGAFPRVILAEGDYRVIARNEGATFESAFKVTAGVDGELEVLAR
jgi:hypothetical protein